MAHPMTQTPTIIPIETPTLGDRSYLVHDGEVAFVVDPQRDIDRVLDLAAHEQVRITHVFETHIHNDYVTGGLALAQATGAAYHVNADDDVSFERTPIRDGDVVEASATMRVRAIATPGHTFAKPPKTLMEASRIATAASAVITVSSCPIWSSAPTTMIPEMAFVTDIKGVCRAWWTWPMT